jgi:hypothetical protein
MADYEAKRLTLKWILVKELVKIQLKMMLELATSY